MLKPTQGIVQTDADQNNQSGPVITSFQCSQGPNNVWTFWGTVSDTNLAGITISFSGTPTMNGKSCTTASDGSFFFQIALQPNESGMVAAVATDLAGLSSPQAFVDVA